MIIPTYTSFHGIARYNTNCPTVGYLFSLLQVGTLLHVRIAEAEGQDDGEAGALTNP